MLMRNIETSCVQGAATTAIEPGDSKGLQLEEALQRDRAKRVERWKRAARRVQLPFYFIIAVAAIVGYGSFFMSIIVAQTGTPNEPVSSLVMGLLAIAALFIFLFPPVWKHLLQPILNRRIERVVAAAEAEGVELNAADYQ